ncbi:MAG TPA: tetratricopeptide repeat protein [Bacteroidota bacterium]
MHVELKHHSWFFLWVAAALSAAPLLITGCSSLPGTAEKSLSPAEKKFQEGQHEMALQHFIDGSVFELRGDNARAVIEYQEALGFEKNHTVYFALSRAYGALGKNLPAIEAGREAVRLKPDNIEYRRNLAVVYLSAMMPDSALAAYEEIVRIDSTGIESWFNLARLYQVRSPAKALATYYRITERFGPEWDVLTQIAELCSKMGKFDSAAAALRQMSDIDPTNHELRHTLGQTYARAGKYDSALAVFNGLRESDSTSLDLKAEIAGVLLLRREYAAANREFEPILAGDTVNVDTKLRIGEMYFNQIEKDSTAVPYARAVFERIRKRAPADWRPYWFLGALGSLQKDDSVAARNFRKVTELASWNADAWVSLSAVFLTKNNFEETARILESALKAVPDDFRVNFFLGVAYSRLSRNADAIRVLEHARSLNPKDVDAMAQLALTYESMHQYNESDSLYEGALRLDPANHLVLNNYSYSLAERNMELDRALEMSRKAVEAQPDNGSYLDTIGWIYYQLGRYADAMKYVKQAIAKGEANAVVYEHLGDIYFKMNNREGALEQWKLALELDSGNSALRDKISRGSL